MKGLIYEANDKGGAKGKLGIPDLTGTELAKLRQNKEAGGLFQVLKINNGKVVFRTAAEDNNTTIYLTSHKGLTSLRGAMKAGEVILLLPDPNTNTEYLSDGLDGGPWVG
jgi:hypothetical protein